MAPLGLWCRKYSYLSPGAEVVCFNSSAQRMDFCPLSEDERVCFCFTWGKVSVPASTTACLFLPLPVCSCLYPCLQSHLVSPVFLCHRGRLSLVSWLSPIFLMGTHWRHVVPDPLQFTLTFKNLLTFGLHSAASFSRTLPQLKWWPFPWRGLSLFGIQLTWLHSVVSALWWAQDKLQFCRLSRLISL